MIKDVKICTRCNLEKPKSEFTSWVNNVNRKYLKSKCKPCDTAYAKEYRSKLKIKNPEKLRMWAQKSRQKFKQKIQNDPVYKEKQRVKLKEYRSRPEIKEKHREYQKKYVKTEAYKQRIEELKKNPAWVEKRKSAWRERNRLPERVAYRKVYYAREDVKARIKAKRKEKLEKR